jgi:hypothetical protein
MCQHHISPRAFTHFLCTRCILPEALALALSDFCSLSAVHMTRVALCEKTADVYNNFCIKPNISIITRETRVQERARHNYLGAWQMISSASGAKLMNIPDISIREQAAAISAATAWHTRRVVCRDHNMALAA